jgi:hypothetical protein
LEGICRQRTPIRQQSSKWLPLPVSSTASHSTATAEISTTRAFERCARGTERLGAKLSTSGSGDGGVELGPTAAWGLATARRGILACTRVALAPSLSPLCPVCAPSDTFNAARNFRHQIARPPLPTLDERCTLPSSHPPSSSRTALLRPPRADLPLLLRCCCAAPTSPGATETDPQASPRTAASRARLTSRPRRARSARSCRRP